MKVNSSQSNIDENIVSKIEEQKLIDNDSFNNTKLIVYPIRWWICFSFCIYCLIQSGTFNFYSPIQAPLERLYKWDDRFIEWLLNTANLTFCCTTIFVSICVDKFGMRYPMLTCCLSLVFCTSLRLIPFSLVGVTGYKVFSILSMICNGVAGSIETLSPPVISMVWFPVNQRTTATSIMAAANYLGVAVGFLPSFFVPEKDSEEEIKAVMLVVYSIFAGVTIILFISFILIFPSRPLTPPSYSSNNNNREDILKGLVMLFKNKKFWILTFSTVLPLGVFSMWMNVIGIIFKKFEKIGLNQTDSGMVGILGSIGGCITAILTGLFSDKFKKKHKIIASILYFLASIIFFIFTLIYIDCIQATRFNIFILVILGSCCIYGTYPLFFELCIEASYPVGEAATSGFMVVSQAVVQSLFLFIPVDKFGTSWMNFTLVICMMICAILLLLFKEEYNRLDFDMKIERDQLNKNRF